LRFLWIALANRSGFLRLVAAPTQVGVEVRRYPSPHKDMATHPRWIPNSGDVPMPIEAIVFALVTACLGVARLYYARKIKRALEEIARLLRRRER
jgi:hypothetical protein